MCRVDLAGRLEAALCVERLGAWIGCGHQFAGLKRTREMRSFLDQLASDAGAPQVGLDERPIDVGAAIIARNDDGKTRRLAPVFEHDDEAGGDVIRR